MPAPGDASPSDCQEKRKLQHAQSLLAQLPEGFRQRRLDWPQRTQRLVERAEELLHGLSEGRQVDRAAARLVKVASSNRNVNDSALPLGKALDATLMAHPVRELMGSSARLIGTRLMRHKPGRRAVIAYRVLMPGNDEPQVLLGKLRARGADTRTPALHASLRAAGLDGRAPLRIGVPASRGIVASPALWLQNQVPGRTLTELLHDPSSTAAASRCGRALALLHSAGVQATRDWSMQDELDVLGRALEAARKNLAGEARRINAIAASAATRLRALGSTSTTGIHRDFYPDQVLIHRGTVWLLDLDLYARGDPAIDLGNFLAHLDEHGLRHHDDAAILAEQGEAFLTAYAAVRAFDPERVAALRLVSLARHIHLSQTIPGRSHTTYALIDHCSRCCAEAIGTLRHASPFRRNPLS